MSSKTEASQDVERILAFASPHSVVGVRDGYYQQVRAVEGYTGVANTQPITFEVQNTLTDAIDLTRSYIATQFIVRRVVNATDGPVTADSAFTLSNNAGARMFSRVSIYLNDVQVADEALQSEGFNHWVSWVDQITEKAAPYGQNAGLRFLTQTNLSGSATEAFPELGFVPVVDSTVPTDLPTAMATGGALALHLNKERKFSNEVEITHSESDMRGFSLARPTANAVGNMGENDYVTRLSPGAASRQRQIVGGATATLIFHPPAALFRQNKMLPPGCRLRIELTKAPTDALFQYRKVASDATAFASANINYVQSRLMLRRVQFDPIIQQKLKMSLDGPVPYSIPLWLARAARFATGTGTNTFQRTGILSGPAAEVVYIAVSRDYSGTNPLFSPYATAAGCLHYTGAVTAEDVGAAGAGRVYTVPAVTGDANPTIQEIYVKVGGKQYPQESIRLTNASGADIFQAYQNYLDAAGVEIVGGAKQPVLSFTQFKTNYTIYPISLRGDGSYHFTGSLARADANASNVGGLEVYIRFSANLALSFDVLVLSYHTGYIALTNGGSNVNKIAY